MARTAAARTAWMVRESLDMVISLLQEGNGKGLSEIVPL
jgi:hypothetical protein